MTDFGGPRTTPTAAESLFVEEMGDDVPGLDLWLHNDSDGTPWMIVSLSFTEDGAVRKTLRLDFDGDSICGGWSAANLNWDDGIRAQAAEVATGPPDGIHVRGGSVEAMAALAAAWFRRHWNAG